MKTFKKALIAIAIGSLMVSGSALARGGPGHGGPGHGGPGNGDGGNDNNTPPPAEQTGFDASSSITSEVTNTKTIGVEHETEFSSDVSVEGDIRLQSKGYSYAGALTDSKQLNAGNEVNNNQTENSGEIGGGAFQGARGNIGANVAGGDNNQQANDAALAVSDAHKVFARATSASFQSSTENETGNVGTSNSAGLSGGAFQNARGNIAVNAAAGVGNSQQNSFSAAVSNGGSSEAASVGVQQSWSNVTNNALAEVSSSRRKGSTYVAVNNDAYIGEGSFQNARGNISANVASGSGNMQRNSLTIAVTR